jgi:hypothetical protein
VSEYVLSDDAVFALAGRGEVVKHFPFFIASVRSVPRNCGCNRTLEQRKIRHEAATAVKRTLLTLNQERKDLLKQVLNAKTITFYIPGPRGVEKHSI